MPPILDLDHQQLDVAHSPAMQKPVTMAATTTIAPTTRLTRITGATVITTITPPITSYHELVLVFGTGTANQLGTGGNIVTSVTTVTDRAVILHYDPRTGTYYANAST